MTGSPYTAASTMFGRSISLDDMKAAMAKVKAMPQGQWVLMSPDGRVWASEKPGEILHTLMRTVPMEDLLPKSSPESNPFP